MRAPSEPPEERQPGERAFDVLATLVVASLVAVGLILFVRGCP